MKNIEFIAICAAAALLTVGCAKDENTDLAPEQTLAAKVYTTVSAASTRTTMDGDYNISWKSGDRIGLFYNTSEVQGEWIITAIGSAVKNGTYQNLPYVLNDTSDGMANGTFTVTVDAENDHPVSSMRYTGNFYWQSNAAEATFYACYPYTFSGVNGGHLDKYDAFPYTLKTTQGGTLDDVAALDLACGSAKAVRGSEEYVAADLSFGLKHLLAVLEFTVTNSTGSTLTVNGLRLAAPENIGGAMTVDLTTGKLSDIGEAVIRAELAQGAVLANGESAKIYMVAAPADCTNSTITVTTSAGTADFTGGKAFEAGKFYTKTLTLTTLTGAEDKTVTVDFEDAELKSVSYEGFSSNTYSNVLEGKSLATLCNDEDSFFDESMLYDGIIYSKSGVGIGHLYNDGTWMGYGVYDSWCGFAVSANHDTETNGFANQFSVCVANDGNNKFAVGFDSPSGGMGEMGTYDTPTIVLEKSGKIKSAKFANSTYTFKTIQATDPNVTYVLKVKGYSNDTPTGEVSVTLAENGTVLDTWKTVDLTALGVIDKATVSLDAEKTASNVQKPAQWLPFYFCIDDVVVEFE